MKNIFYIIILLCFAFANGQSALDSLLLKENKQSVPYITVAELVKKKNFVLLDSREKVEFETSHIKNASFVGYDKFKLKKIKNLLPKDKNEPIVVYCSLGIRSEDIAEKLQKAGYTNVYNLYGGIFEWKNKDNPVIDTKGNETENVHTFDENWSIWLKKGIKIYEKEKSKKDKQ
ncbi:putative adenylyltransferase/sulfurtransferase MoeZ [Kordia antarctica]|uniref:Putative adenylyltransferase/sulfurtransferase MoeZ n=1 Tax=Kordia antarctica TaxID=1218801 RepID=A0A7L4ZK67_9FLAO|nr:rhodanese-like domain-containing protein [Kordia antarctica]QHI37032.1 putative adenylyltransferase/sulfurtransferase MoeZ [Kordia antarctica]